MIHELKETKNPNIPSEIHFFLSSKPIMLNMNTKGSQFFKCQLGTEMTESACPGAEVRASVHRDGHKNRPNFTLERWITSIANQKRLIINSFPELFETIVIQLLNVKKQIGRI